jgi:hypothetical protein
MYKLRLTLLTILCYAQMVYEIDVMIPVCVGAFCIERYIKFVIGGNEKCQALING